MSARAIPALAAVLLLAGPPAALADISQGDPTSSYAKTPDCSGTNRMPVEVVFENFPSPGSAEIQMDTQIAIHEPPWDDFATDTKKLNMDGTGGVHCQAQTAGRAVTSSDGDFRTILRLWPYTGGSGPLAGAAAAQHTVTGISGCSWATNSGGGGGPGGFTGGRQRFEQAFQGANPTSGPYPLKEYPWGNTAEFQVCDSNNTVASDGNVAIIRPKDDFGFHENLTRQLLREADSAGTHTIADCPQAVRNSYGAITQSVIDQLQEAGVTTMRFGMDWSTVAPCSGAAETQWDWDRWDTVVPQLAAAGIKSIIVVKVPPPKGPNSSDPEWTDPTCSQQSGSALVNLDSSEALSAWQTYVKDVATRYGAYARAIEVWNEENTENYWGGCDPDASQYLTLLDRARQGVSQSTHPNLPIMLGSPAPVTSTVAGKIEWQDYLRSILNNWSATTQSAVDYIGLHPYRSMEEKQAGTLPDESALAQLGAARTIVSNHGLDKPIWVTEVGTTSTGPSGLGTYVGSNQGLRDYQIYDALRNAGGRVTTMYRFADLSNDPADKEAGFGAVNYPGLMTKDAYCRLAQERTGIYLC